MKKTFGIKIAMANQKDTNDSNSYFVEKNSELSRPTGSRNGKILTYGTQRPE
jgi:hypothetical protein